MKKSNFNPEETINEVLARVYNENYKYVENPNLPYKNTLSRIQYVDTSTGIYGTTSLTYLRTKARKMGV